MIIFELVILLPLLGAVLGAFVGAFANGWYRNREAKQDRERELKGMTLLLFAEYGHNDTLLKLLGGSSISQDLFPLSRLQTDVWKKTRVRVAQLVSNEHTAALVAYYEAIEDILEMYNNETISNMTKKEFIKEDAERAARYGRSAMMYGSKYMFKDHSEFTDSKYRKFVEEAEKSVEP